MALIVGVWKLIDELYLPFNIDTCPHSLIGIKIYSNTNGEYRLVANKLILNLDNGKYEKIIQHGNDKYMLLDNFKKYLCERLDLDYFGKEYLLIDYKEW